MGPKTVKQKGAINTRDPGDTVGEKEEEEAQSL